MTQLRWYQILAVSLVLMLGISGLLDVQAATKKAHESRAKSGAANGAKVAFLLGDKKAVASSKTGSSAASTPAKVTSATKTTTESTKEDKQAAREAKKAAKKAERESKRLEKKAKSKGKSTVIGSENLGKKAADSGDFKAKVANDKDASDKSPADKPANEKQATVTSLNGTGTNAQNNETKNVVPGDTIAPESKVSNKQETTVVPLEPIEVAGDEPDPALICILRDLAKALKDSPEAQAITGTQQKEALRVAQQALSRVVDNPKLTSNRIISGTQKNSMESTMTAESWQSGDLELSKKSHVSFSVLWAKKIDGVITINVTGTYPQANNQLSEFVLVASGRSGVESGFDIQSQSQVNFWLGKLSNLFIESGLSQANSEPALKAKRTTVSGVITRKGRLKAQLIDSPIEKNKEKAAFGLPSLPVAGGQGRAEGANLSNVAVQNTGLKPDGLRQAMESLSGAPAIATTSMSSQSADANIIKRVPSAESYLLFPERAIAGEPVTVSILNANNYPEAFVELSFNGEVGTSNKDGRVTFWVQEEAIPGPSLKVNVPCREQISGAVIHVLQPLNKPGSEVSPKIDSVYSVINPSRIVTINGHHFDGRAEANKVSIDGVVDAKLLVSSPVQIKALVPYNLSPGQHALTVTSQGRVSNVSNFEMVAVEVQSTGHDKKRSDANKIIVRARGTQKPLHLKVKNYSPDIIKFADGNEMRVITSGGQDNAVVVGVKRLKKGNFRVVASIE